MHSCMFVDLFVGVTPNLNAIEANKWIPRPPSRSIERGKCVVKLYARNAQPSGGNFLHIFFVQWCVCCHVCVCLHTPFRGLDAAYQPLVILVEVSLILPSHFNQILSLSIPAFLGVPLPPSLPLPLSQTWHFLRLLHHTSQRFCDPTS